METVAWFKERLDVCYKDLQDLTKGMENAGVGNKGDYRNQIEAKENDIRYYQQKIADNEQSKTPEQMRVFCYVITSIEDRIKYNVGDDLYCCFECDCYHVSENKYWKPFKGKGNIDTLLLEVKAKYPFELKYLDGDSINEDDWLKLDSCINDSIAIIDLFSLDSSNMPIASKFDTKRTSLIMPLCYSLVEDLRNFADTILTRFRVLNAMIRKKSLCELFSFHCPSDQKFEQDLLRILKQKYPIVNQVNCDSEVRDLNISF